MKYIALVFSNFKRHRLRTALTIASVAVAFILFAYLGAIRNAFRFGVSVAGEDRLVVRHKVTLILPLPQSYERRIEQIDGVENAIQQSWFGGLYQERQTSWGQIAVDADEFFDMYPEFVVPEKQKQDFLRLRTAAIVGRKTAERYGWKIGDRIPLGATFNVPKSGNTWTFDLVGIYDGKYKDTDTSGFYFRHDYLDENRLYGEGTTGWYTIRVKDPKDAERVADAVDALFANSPQETSTETEMAFIKGFAQQIGNVGKIVQAVLTAVFFIILLVAGNTMAQAVRERMSELGVLKAIGFTDTQVLWFVLAEALLIAIAGGGIGLLLGYLAVKGGDPTGGALPVFTFPVRD
ncbi:MAG TPA: ABC transporter permease, partial [Thermoanaerobaculia bacterium]|nr:ABC transporter permease [Thermoanaerobaculia bacterium]